MSKYNKEWNSSRYQAIKSDPERYAAYLARKRAEDAKRGKRCPSQRAEAKRNWRKKNPIKAQRIREANHAVETALESGKLVRPGVCSRCSQTECIQGHHWSYEKENWLDVIWLCRMCHAAEHRKLRVA